ncbi:MAG: DUF4430 domain-containing protein [Pseudoflavonifractor sp.]|nr:DUF4430 domain-containing protein [Pseudoflavonifractor sp.]
MRKGNFAFALALVLLLALPPFLILCSCTASVAQAAEAEDKVPSENETVPEPPVTAQTDTPEAAKPSSATTNSSEISVPSPNGLSEEADSAPCSPAVPPAETALPLMAPTCTLSVNCGTILDNLDALSDGKEALIPSDGNILYLTQVPFTEGESAYEVLNRVAQNRKMQMEVSITPAYNSVYLEGISNIYEFDCGELSGWVYRVNSVFPSGSCSEYKVQDGDLIEFLYSCDLGRDVGGSNW